MSVDLPPLDADLTVNSLLSDDWAAPLIASRGDLGEARILDKGCRRAHLSGRRGVFGFVCLHPIAV